MEKASSQHPQKAIKGKAQINFKNMFYKIEKYEEYEPMMREMMLYLLMRRCSHSAVRQT